MKAKVLILGVFFILLFGILSNSWAQVFFIDKNLEFSIENILNNKIDAAENLLKIDSNAQNFQTQELLVIIGDYKKGIINKEYFMGVVKGWDLILKKEYNKSFDEFIKIVHMYPNYFRASFIINDVLMIKVIDFLLEDNIDESVKLIKLFPGNQQSNFSKEFLLQLVNNYQNGNKVTQDYLKKIFEGWIVLFTGGDADLAIQKFKDALNIDNVSVFAYNALGLAYLSFKGDRKEAIKYYQKVLDRDGNNLESLQSLAFIYGTLGEDKLSQEYRQKYDKLFINQSTQRTNAVPPPVLAVMQNTNQTSQ